MSISNPDESPKTAKSVDDDYVNVEAPTEKKSEQKHYSVTIPNTASKFTRVFDSRLMLGKSRPLKIDAGGIKWLLPSKVASEASQILALTSDNSILYLSSPESLKNVSVAVLRVILEATGDARSPDFLIELNVTFEDQTAFKCPHAGYNCAEFSLENECNQSCGLKTSQSGRCQWISEG